jgi:hypothetical protein
MMLPDQRAAEDEICPIRDELLGEFYRSSKLRVPDLLATMTPDTRALLALFCYRRSHLQPLGLTIAGTCTEDSLVCWGGRLGAALFAKSRERLHPLSISRQASRRIITLATGTLRMFSSDESLEEQGAS